MQSRQSDGLTCGNQFPDDFPTSPTSHCLGRQGVFRVGRLTKRSSEVRCGIEHSPNVINISGLPQRTFKETVESLMQQSIQLFFFFKSMITTYTEV